MALRSSWSSSPALTDVNKNINEKMETEPRLKSWICQDGPLWGVIEGSSTNMKRLLNRSKSLPQTCASSGPPIRLNPGPSLPLKQATASWNRILGYENKFGVISNQKLWNHLVCGTARLKWTFNIKVWFGPNFAQSGPPDNRILLTDNMVFLSPA